MIQIQKFKINGMHCASCAMNIDGELEDADGVLEAKTSYARQVTEVRFESEKITSENIKSLIQKTGYTVDN